MEMTFPANLLTDAKHPAFSTNHLYNTNEIKHYNYVITV